MDTEITVEDACEIWLRCRIDQARANDKKSVQLSTADMQLAAWQWIASTYDHLQPLPATVARKMRVVRRRLREDLLRQTRMGVTRMDETDQRHTRRVTFHLASTAPGTAPGSTSGRASA